MTQTNLEQLIATANKHYNEGSTAGARVLYLEIITTLQATIAELERHKAELIESGKQASDANLKLLKDFIAAEATNAQLTQALSEAREGLPKWVDSEVYASEEYISGNHPGFVFKSVADGQTTWLLVGNLPTVPGCKDSATSLPSPPPQEKDHE